MTIASLSIFDRLPMELIILIALFLCPRDLHTLTCVSRSMAEITCPLYFRERNFAPQKSQYCISVTGDAFSALPVWRRSLCFVPKPILSCTFDGASVDAQIRCLRTMISTLPPKSAFDEINLWGDTSLDKLWDLLEVIDRAGFRTVDIDSWRVFHIYQDVGTYSKLVALENLRLNYAFLSPSVWASILSRLVIPNLRKLHIVGDVSWSSLTDFLQRHPRIREVQLRMPSGAPIPNLRTHKPTLSLPMLEVISGSLDHVFALLRILPSPPHLRTLSIEAVTNLPYRTFVDNVMRCLALCEGMFRLDIGFCPSKCQSRLISSINRHAISIRRLQSTTVRARICSLRIRVQNISDENILVSHSPLKQALTNVRPGLL
jgi:hypothetical protein